MNENNHIKLEVDGITFLSSGRYYEGINNWVCHKVKELDHEAIDYAARNMAKIIPTEQAILIPVPGHTGVSTNALQLAKAISIHSGIPVIDALRGKDRESNYQAKYAGHPLTEEQMGFRQVRELPPNLLPIIIDNCVDTGTSAKAAYHALGNKGVVLTYAMSDTLLIQQDNKIETIRR